MNPNENHDASGQNSNSGPSGSQPDEAGDGSVARAPQHAEQPAQASSRRRGRFLSLIRRSSPPRVSAREVGWAQGDAAFIALAGGPIRANRIYRRTTRGLSSPAVVHGVLVEPVGTGLTRVSRPGRQALILREVEYQLDGKRRLMVVKDE
jgi:hypothetical protein